MTLSPSARGNECNGFSRAIESLERRRLLSVALGGPVGEEFMVNTTTVGYQWDPSVARDADGDFVVVWETINQDGDGYGIYGQRFNALGEKQGGEFLVNVTTEGWQTDAEVAMDAAGNFVVVWETPWDIGPSGLMIVGRRFAADGTPLGGEFEFGDSSTIRYGDPEIAMNDAGAFVITAEGRPNFSGPDPKAVFARSFAPDGTPIGVETPVNTYRQGLPIEPAVAMDNAGNYTVVWRDVQPTGNSWDIYAQRFDATGAPVGGETRVNTDIAGFQQNPDVALDADGDAVVTWEWVDSIGVEDIHAQRFDNTGAPQGGEFIINTTRFGRQYGQTVSMSGDGSFVVAWEDAFNDPDSSSGVYAQRFAATGAPLGQEFRLSASFDGVQIDPAVAIDEDGDVVAAWSDPIREGPSSSQYNYNIHARLFNVDDVEPTTVSGRFNNDNPAHRVILEFSDDVVTTLSKSDLIVQGLNGATLPAGGYSFSYDPTRHAATLAFPGGTNGGLAEGRYRATVLAAGVADVIGNRLAGNYTLDFAYMKGDATGDGTVDIADFSVLAVNFNQPGVFSQGDFNYSGTVDIGDFSILASRFNQSLPAARSTPAASAKRGDELFSSRVIDLMDI